MIIIPDFKGKDLKGNEFKGKDFPSRQEEAQESAYSTSAIKQAFDHLECGADASAVEPST